MLSAETPSLTDIKVPGKKKSVTRVMILMETVSCFVFRAMSCISFVMFSMASAERLLAFVLRNAWISCSC